jgi:hypothetical protein
MASILPNDANIFYPGGPTGGGSGAATGLSWALAASGASATCFCPTYFQVWLNTPGSASATLNFTTNTDPNAITFLTVVVDGGAATTTNVSALSSLSLFTGLGAGVHEVVVEISECSYKAWSLALAGQPLSWQSITVTAGTVTEPITTTQPGLMLLYGDSRSAGLNVLGSSTQSFPQASGRAIARALGCEVASHVFPGVGWQVAAGTTGQGCPIFTPGNATQSAWNQLNGSFARTFPSALNYVFVEGMGTNDALRGITAAEITASTSGFLAAIRPEIPASCRIIVNPCWAVGTQSVLTQTTLVAATALGVSNYLASTSDPLCFYVPISLTAPELAWAYNAGTGGTAGTASYWDPDGIHQYAWVNETIATLCLQGIANAEGRFTPHIGGTLIQGH